MKLTRNGSTFQVERAEAEDELDFFASDDRWCRPVMARTGPDGALWVVDMYRYMIEHPEWLPVEGREELKPFYRSGEGMGRIYRIFRSTTAPPPVPLSAYARVTSAGPMEPLTETAISVSAGELES